MQNSCPTRLSSEWMRGCPPRTRKLREFCARVLQLRIQQQFKIKFMIIDARAMNAIDLTGCSMLEIRESCYTNGGVKLVVAGLKAPVARSLIRAEVDKVVKKSSG
ncbi:unnamed protein product [Prorocentrum cordatum]|uniref:STAS domain-containing protein n=1 Tax=Prorocentrum cordatum TaxID=2364126 RepID=A0ABN9QLD3_9DINO|nr:unnamed protein product [Polarella glacialis]